MSFLGSCCPRSREQRLATSPVYPQNLWVLEVVSSHQLSSACGVCRLGFPHSTKPSVGSKIVPVVFGVVPVQALGFFAALDLFKTNQTTEKNPLNWFCTFVLEWGGIPAFLRTLCAQLISVPRGDASPQLWVFSWGSPGPANRVHLFPCRPL